MTGVGIDRNGAITPVIEGLLEEARGCQPERLPRREALTESALALTFLLTAGAMAALLPWERSLDFAALGVLSLVYAATSRIRLEDGAGYTVPTQIVFIPMLYFLPAPLVPLAVAAAMLLGNLPEYVRGTKHASRAIVSIPDAWHAVGPALVFALAGAGGPELGDWPVVAGALAAQLALDFGVSTLREWLGAGIPPQLQPRLLAWVYLGDACLTPLGLLGAVIVADEPLALMLLLPICALLPVYGRERENRISAALELSRAYRGTARLLGEVLDADDPYTAHHSRGVVELSLLVADRLGLDDSERRNVEFGALLHDVGKISIPKEIVNKPDALSDDEWVVMRQHTVRGQALLDRVGGMLCDVGRVVRASHERFDGGGYPDGLAGADIPLAARIVSCCDAYNAMTTSRPYRPAMAEDDALRELVDNAGGQFDPKVVRTLIALLRRPVIGLPRLRQDAAGEPDAGRALGRTPAHFS